MTHANDTQAWPELSLREWQDTYATLHLWMQCVGKVRLALSPMINHWWQAPFYVTARGLTTSPMFFGTRLCQIDFDFLSHELQIQAGDGEIQTIALAPRTVADFYQELMQALQKLGINISIWTTPVELANPIPFEQDTKHSAYDPEYAHRLWHILVQTHRVMTEFRSRFVGKVSPVHFFWGSFDLAVTRFSGRTAPPHPGAPNISDKITRPAYSHEVSSIGFWPGGSGIEEPVFYAYAYPTPVGFSDAIVQPKEASFNQAFGEFLLPYEAVRLSANPDAMLLEFFQSTYEAAAKLAKWDRAALEDRSALVL